MKKFLTLALAAVMTLTLLAGCGDSGTPAGSGSNAPAGGNLIFTTGGETGTYYAFGGVIAQDVTANTPTTVTAISSDGSKANVLLLKSGDAQLGFCQSDVMAYAYNGTSTFADTGAYFFLFLGLHGVLHRGEPLHGAGADRDLRPQHQDRG